MNLLIIGNDVDELAKEVWTANTNYTVLNMSPYLWGKEFKKFHKSHKDLIITSTAGQFLQNGIDDFVNLMNEYDFQPVFIAEDKESIERLMHTNVEETLPYSVLFMGARNTEEYKDLVSMLKGYISGKGFMDGDNIIPTPTEGEGTTTQE